MGLYGIYGDHTQEACPLYNEENRKHLLRNVPTVEKLSQDYNVKISHQFHSGLEHTFLWVVEAVNPHIIEELMSRTAGRFNTLRTVPVITFQTLIQRLKKVETGTFQKTKTRREL
jgi:DNA-binding HxlR family transcriptional regulator